MTPLLGTKTSSTPVGDVPTGDRRAARSPLSCALWRGMGRLWRGMGGMGRPEPLSAHRPHQQQDLSGFHETRITAFSRITAFVAVRFSVGARGVASPETAVRTTAPAGKSLVFSSPLFTIVRHCSPLFTKNIVLRQCPRTARSLLSCALWRGMGGRRPPRRQHGLSVFSSHETRNMLFPSPSGDSKESNPKPGQQVFTNHETRITKHGFYASLPTISHDFPAFPAISRGVGGCSGTGVQEPLGGKSHKNAQNPASAGGCMGCTVSRGSRRPPGCLGCGQHKMNS